MSNVSTIETIDWDERYRAAESLLGGHDGLVPNGSVLPRWIDTETFWYLRRGMQGRELRIVRATAPDFDRTVPLHRLAEIIGATAEDAPPLVVHAADHEGRAIAVSVGEELWTVDATSGTASTPLSLADHDHRVVNPQGTAAIELIDHNLHLVRDGESVQLTTDGTAEYAYASSPLAARYQHDALGTSVQGLWSPDGTKFFTLRTDERNVAALPLLEYFPEEGVRPQVRWNRTSLPGDEHVTMFELLIVDIESGTIRPVDHARQPAIRMNDTVFAAEMAWWSADSSTAYFVHVPRGEIRADVIACDAQTGTTRVLFSEESDSYVDLSTNVYGPALIVPLPQSEQVAWYSERSGYGHLYLYDLTTGELIRPLTDGEWQVREVLGTSSDERTLFVLAGGYPGTVTPYQTRVVGITISEGPGSVRVLRADAGTHVVRRANSFEVSTAALLAGERPQGVSGFSPDAGYFVDTITSLESLPRTILCDRKGHEVRVLEEPSADGLPDEWTWPIPIAGTGADGATMIHGAMFLPRDYDPRASYPVIDLVYGGPQLHNVPDGAFSSEVWDNTLIEALALAQLGAFVTLIDGRGTTERSRAFRNHSWRRVQDASDLADHVALIRQVSEKYPQMDLERVGITGFSAGGYASALGVFRHGDFYKVAVAGGGNYDQSLFWHTWGERYHGAYEAEHYATQAAKSYVDGFSGKILFIHGLRDHGCHPAALFQLLQAMIDANVDYDLLLLPDAAHSISGYGQRRRMDYFVSHLMGGDPPTVHRSFTSKFDEVSAHIAAAGLNVDEGDDADA